MAKIICLISAIIFIMNANAAKLDISAEAKTNTKSYENLINSNYQKNLSYFSQDAEISFTVKKINLEKTENSDMDISVGIKAIGIDKSSKVINSIQLSEGINRYPAINNAIINQSFIRINNFYKEGIIATFGRQKYTLGQGLVLSDNDLGFTGIKIENKRFLKLDNTEAFLWRETKNENIYTITGINLSKNWGDGTWQTYYVSQYSGETEKEIGWTAKKRNKKFTGIRYFISKNQINFDGEFVTQRGNAQKINGENVDYKSYAFLMRGEWYQKTPILGKTKTRLSYSKSSGNPSSVSNKDSAFYPDFSLRFNGFEHTGTGYIFSANIFDTLKTSNTINGLPDGLSGLNTVNIGFDFPYKKLWLSVDYLIYKAAQNIYDNGNTKLGIEWDIKASWPMSEKIDFNIIYANFKPQGALLPSNSKYKNTKLFSFNIIAKF